MQYEIAYIEQGMATERIEAEYYTENNSQFVYFYTYKDGNKNEPGVLVLGVQSGLIRSIRIVPT